MAGSVPWSVNAVDPEAWADARDAARRSGQSVGEWLESAIRNAANDRHPAPRNAPRQEFIQPDFDPIERRLDEIAERIEHVSRQREATPARAARSEAAVLHSIEALNERIDTLSRDMRAGERNGPAEVRAAIQKLDDRIEHLLSRSRIAEAGASPDLELKLEGISRAIETMSRQLAQENARYESQGYDAEPVPASVEDLDNAIAEIMMRQAVLDGSPLPRSVPKPPSHKPRREAAAPAAAPADFSGLERQLKAMADEMQALRKSGLQNETVSALRAEVAELSAKLGELAPRRSLESIERAIENMALRIDRAGGARNDETLTEVVDALHEIRSALADVRPAESFVSVEKDLHSLSSKLDNLGTRGIDGSAVARLQEQTAEIRDLLSSALPSEALHALVEQIEVLVAKFEERRGEPDSAIVDVLTAFDRRIESLSDRIEAASRQAPPVPAFDDIRQRLDDLQEAIARADTAPNERMEATLRTLAQKVDATEERLGTLGAIERGLAELLGQLEETRASAQDTAETAAKAAVRQMAAAEPTRWGHAEPEFQDSSSERRDEPPAPVARVSRSEPRLITPRRNFAAEAEELEADVPLEPGSGVPRVRLQSAALRIAQSEAALGDLATPAPEPGKTSDFIAAARRAAQAAQAEPAAETARSKGSALRGRVASLFGGGKRALLIALTAFLLIVAALRFFDASLLTLPFGSTPAPKPARVEPKASLPAIATPEAQKKSEAPAQESHTAHPLVEREPIAAMPPAGVLGDGQDLHFSKEAILAPETTGSTSARKPAGTIQTASAPAGKEAKAEPAKPETAKQDMTDAADALPAALGTAALRAAALAGQRDAAYEIGARYLDGHGVKADAVEAAKWLEQAFSKGSLPAAYRLGSLHEKGLNGRKNIAEAKRYYIAAAEGGNIKAMHNLAVIYAEGGESPADLRNAARWFRSAADRGVRDSQYNLGVLYARGLGVEQNFAESYRWFAIAANQGDEDAGKKRDDVAKRLDVQTLVATKLAVQTWVPAKSDPAANEVRLKSEWDNAGTPPRRRTVKK